MSGNLTAKQMHTSERTINEGCRSGSIVVRIFDSFNYGIFPEVNVIDGKRKHICYIDNRFGFLIDKINTQPIFTTEKQCVKYLEKELRRAKKELSKEFEKIK